MCFFDPQTLCDSENQHLVSSGGPPMRPTEAGTCPSICLNPSSPPIPMPLPAELPLLFLLLLSFPVRGAGQTEAGASIR